MLPPKSRLAGGHRSRMMLRDCWFLRAISWSCCTTCSDCSLRSQGWALPTTPHERSAMREKEWFLFHGSVYSGASSAFTLPIPDRNITSPAFQGIFLIFSLHLLVSPVCDSFSGTSYLSKENSVQPQIKLQLQSCPVFSFILKARFIRAFSPLFGSIYQ